METQTTRDKELVYGDSGWGSLVFLQRDLADLYATLAKSNTWGELKASLSADDYHEAIERAFWLTDKAYESQAMPQPEEEFNLYEVSNYCSTDWPDFPLQAMVEWMPADIQEQYGEVKWTMFDGPHLSIDAEQKDEIIQALEEQGYICIEDDFVVSVAMRKG